MSQGLMLLKEIQCEVAQTESLHVDSPRVITPQAQREVSCSANPYASSFTLSDALEDVMSVVHEEARAEQCRRAQVQTERELERRAREEANESERRAEIQARLSAESARQHHLNEARRISMLRDQYQAAVARGEQVEFPAELAQALNLAPMSDERQKYQKE